jgi:hypothetical protein
VSTISIVPLPGSEMTMGYPYRLDVAVTGPEASESATLRSGDAEELTSERVVFLYEFTPESAGIHRLDAELDFSVCTGPTCTPKTVRFDWSIAVTP